MTLYRVAMTLAFPALLIHAIMQALRGVIPWRGVAERLGRVQATADAAIWLHGASLGELTSARPVLDRLRQALPARPVIVTCNTGTARAMAVGWHLPGVTAALAPFDLGWCLAAFQARVRPDALILVESELWPARIAMMQPKPVILVGARLSERSARRWAGIAGGLLGHMLAQVTLLSAQDAASEARFVTLGLPPSRVAPRLMLKAALPVVQRDLPFANPHRREETLLAASTHEGDESPILDAFFMARAAGTFRHLILAPRHPHRASVIAKAVRARGLTIARRSAGDVPRAATDVHLADTTGEMDHWYRMSGATLIGGTFSDRGGHTPFEPALHGSAILHGPDVRNFAEVYDILDRDGAAALVPDWDALATAVATMTVARQQTLADRARVAISSPGDLDGLTAAIVQVLGGGDGKAGQGRH